VKRNYFIPYLSILILPMSELEKEEEENKDTEDTSNEEEPKE
jgi:hypothetical protein